MNQVNTPFPYSQESGAKKFWRVVFGTMVGFIFTYIVLFILSIFFLIGIIAGISDTETTTISSNSILKINLTGNLRERAQDNPFENTALESYSINELGLDDLLQCINTASTDSKIKGISLNIGMFTADPASLKELRDALETYKSSGKFLYAYSENYSQGGYYLASVADKLYINRLGSIDLKGLAFQVMFYKGLIDKAELDIQVIRHGQFKSAVEPYLMDKMSEANRTQMTVLANTLWETMVNQISKSRNITPERINGIADSLLCENAQKACQLGLADGICHYSEYETILKEKVEIGNEDKLNYASLKDYRKSIANTNKSKNKIAVIYAVGNIIDGKGDDTKIGSETLCKEIRKAYQDKNVKAIVLRVNSPGGSAVASEIIWNEIELAKKAGKKVVTSMSGYAASGGYYISCNSDAIVAQPNTLTGSIGVFGIIPSIQRMLEKKIGITFDVVTTNKHSDFGRGRKMDELELQKMHVMIEDVYALFTQRVASGRNMTVAQVDSIGQGRVWAGKDAIAIGLVDTLGSLQDAVNIAAKYAEIDNYRIIYYPDKMDWFTKIVSSTSESKVNNALKEQLGEWYFTYQGIQTVLEAQGVQARIPMDLIIE